jgi:type IX secretion system PorP/SprF family membrane protein
LVSQAQDIHFSQFYAEPWFINPAKTGMFPGNYRLSGAYRNQWGHVTAPFRTFSASGELGWDLKGASKDIFGIGAHAYSDRSGDGNFTINNVGISSAYTFGLDRFHHHFFGIGGGFNYVNTGFNTTNLRFDNEYTGVGSQEKFNNTHVSYADFSVGLEYTFVHSDKFGLNGGWAVHHINQPNAAFIDNDENRIYRKNTFNFGATYTVGRKYQFYPRVLLAQQGPHLEINTGTFAKVKLDKARKEQYALYMGLWYRWGDAVVPVARFDIHDLSIGLSYDINTSSLYQASDGRGGSEITVLYTGFMPKMGKKRLPCSRF